MDIKADLTWIQKHERILIVFLVLAVAGFLGNKWLNYDAAKKDAAYAVLAQKLEDQKAVNDKNAAQSAQIQAQYQEIVDTLSRQNASLMAAINSRDAALKQKQQQIASMTLPQVAKEWENTLKLPSGALPVQGESIVVSEPAARQTVTELAKTATLEADLSDAIQLGNNYKTEVDVANKVISAQDVEIAGLNSTIGIQDQTCKAEVASVKADARKSKRKWFIAGYVSGFVSGIATRILMKF